VIAPQNATTDRPERPAGYWERIERIVAQAPPLTDRQRATIRTAFTQPEARRTAA
jgi:predicted DNA binding protein